MPEPGHKSSVIALHYGYFHPAPCGAGVKYPCRNTFFEENEINLAVLAPIGSILEVELYTLVFGLQLVTWLTQPKTAAIGDSFKKSGKLLFRA
jgi:hypothetical protein